MLTLISAMQYQELSLRVEETHDNLSQTSLGLARIWTAYIAITALLIRPVTNSLITNSVGNKLFARILYMLFHAYQL
jgi:hypothetical protein